MTAKKVTKSKAKSRKVAATKPQAKKPATVSDKKGTAKVMTENTAPNTTPQPSQPSAIEVMLTALVVSITELKTMLTWLCTQEAERIAKAAELPAIAATLAPTQPAAPKPSKRPGEGTIGGQVWACVDYLHQQLGRFPSKDEVVAQFAGKGVNELTVATQYSKCRKAAGMPRETRVPQPAALPAGTQTSFALSAPAPAPVVQPAPVAAPAAPPVPAFPWSAPTAAPAAPPAPAFPWSVKQ